MTIDDLIAKAVKEKRLDTLSLYLTSNGWSANAKRPDGGWQCARDADPVRGLRTALNGLWGYSEAVEEEETTEEDIFG